MRWKQRRLPLPDAFVLICLELGEYLARLKVVAAAYTVYANHPHQLVTDT